METEDLIKACEEFIYVVHFPLSIEKFLWIEEIRYFFLAYMIVCIICKIL